MCQKICPICKSIAGINFLDPSKTLRIICEKCGQFDINFKINQWFIQEWVPSEMYTMGKITGIFGNSFESIQKGVFNDQMRSAMSTLIKQKNGNFTFDATSLPQLVEDAYKACPNN